MSLSSVPPAELAMIPAMEPPQGFKSNFTDPGIDGSNAQQTVIVVTFLSVLTFLVVCARLYTRIYVKKVSGWEDWTSLFAVIGACAYTGCIDYGYTHGLGVHQWNVSVAQLENMVPLLKVFNYLYGPFIFFAKLSICLLFLRIFSPKPFFKCLIYGAIAYNFLLHFVGTIIAICICTGSAINFFSCGGTLEKLDLYVSGFNIFSDFYLLVLPIYSISTLQMKTKQKLAVSLVFFAGFLACLSSILGMYYRVLQYDSPDVTWTLAAVEILSVFEIDACIIVGCLPLFKTYFHSKYFKLSSLRSIRSRLLGSSRKTESEGSSNQYASNQYSSNSNKPLPAKPARSFDRSTTKSDSSIGSDEDHQNLNMSHNAFRPPYELGYYSMSDTEKGEVGELPATS